jgi:bacteriocin-like protein
MNANTNIYGMGEIRELTDDELDAVIGGALDGYMIFGCANGNHISLSVPLSVSSGSSVFSTSDRHGFSPPTK